jgi:hypothetical protein
MNDLNNAILRRDRAEFGEHLRFASSRSEDERRR